MNNKRRTTLYATIIPVWFMLIIPSMWIIILPYTFLLVTLVMWLSSKFFSGVEFKPLFRKSIIKAFLVGFSSDAIGSAFLFLSQGNFGGWWYEYITTSVVLNPMDNIYSFCFTLLGIALAGYLVYLMDSRIALRDMNYSDETRRKVALALAVMTIPVLFLLPSRTLYDPERPVYNFTHHIVWSVCSACDITPDTPLNVESDALTYANGFKAGYYVSEALNTAATAESDVTRAPEYRLRFWNPTEGAAERSVEAELWFIDDGRALFRYNGQFYLADEYQSNEVMKVFTGEADREIAEAEAAEAEAEAELSDAASTSAR